MLPQCTDAARQTLLDGCARGEILRTRKHILDRIRETKVLVADPLKIATSRDPVHRGAYYRDPDCMVLPLLPKATWLQGRILHEYVHGMAGIQARVAGSEDGAVRIHLARHGLSSPRLDTDQFAGYSRRLESLDEAATEKITTRLAEIETSEFYKAERILLDALGQKGLPFSLFRQAYFDDCLPDTGAPRWRKLITESNRIFGRKFFDQLDTEIARSGVEAGIAMVEASRPVK